MKIKQGCNTWINNQNNVAASSTAAPIRAAEWNEFFTVNRDAAIATFSCCGMKSHAINEGCHLTLASLKLGG
jgi:hypothetical protein